MNENNTKINSLLESEKMLSDQMNELRFKNLYLEAYSRRENIKFFSIPKEDDENTEETLRNFMEDDLGYRNARTVEIQRVHRLSGRRRDSGPRPIIARFLRYKDIEDIFLLGRRLKGNRISDVSGSSTGNNETQKRADANIQENTEKRYEGFF